MSESYKLYEVKKQLLRCVKKDLYLRHRCKTSVSQISGYFYDWPLEIISRTYLKIEK